MSWKLFEKALLDYNKKEVDKILFQFLSESNGIDFIDTYIVKSLTSIGQQWEDGKVALSQVYMSSRLCENVALQILSEKKTPIKKTPPVAIMTLEDFHTLGKRIVSSVIKASGYELMDYGTLQDLDEIYEKVAADGLKILIISTLMYPSALKIKKITQRLHEHHPEIKVLVGGAPFLMDDRLWEHVGADAMGRSASDSVKCIEQWVGEVSI